MTRAAEPCERLAWDSEFFGIRIGRVSAPALAPSTVEAIRQWVRDEGVDCLYFLASSSDGESVRLAEEAGFRLVDIRVTMARNLDGPGPDGDLPDGVEPHRAGDVERLESIAAVSHRDTRFYADPGFPQERCDELYRTWIRNSCTGFADQVLTARAGQAADGYLTCHLRPDAGQIGLIAVAPDARHAGMGAKLVVASLSWFRSHGRDRAVVVTQGRNAPAMRLYERMGFSTESMHLWYHWWPPTP